MNYFTAGQKKFSARDLNEMAAVVNATRANGRGPTSKPSDAGSTFIVVRNDTGAALEFGSVLAITGVPNEPDTATKLDLFKYGGNALVTVDIPTSADAGKFVVLQEPCPIDGYARAVISGPAKVQINVTDAAHGFADVTDGDETLLTSGTTGVPILYKQSGTGTKWAIVNIGGGSGGASSYLVTVVKDGGVVGPPSTWTYTCTQVGGSLAWAAVANRTLRASALRYDYAPDGSYGLVYVVAGTPYLFIAETPQTNTCP